MSIQGNIWKLYIIKIAKWFSLVMPFMALFIKDNGLENFHTFLLLGIYNYSIVFMEIPSGYFADIWGRKKTLVLGTIFSTLGFVFYSFANDFTGFLFAQITLGISLSFISGSDSAMLFDSLAAIKKERSYTKIEGRITSAGNFAEMGAAILGGLLASYFSLRAPFIAQIGVAALAIPASLLLIEPPRLKEDKGSFKHILRIVKHALYDNKKLKWQIIYSSVIGGATLLMAWMLPVYLKEDLQINESILGIVWALLNGLLGVVSWYAYKIELFAGKRNTIILIALFIALGYIMVGVMSTLWVFVFISLFYATRGVATPVLKNYINELTSSDMRATVLSLRTFLIRIFAGSANPLIGWYAEIFTLQQALLLTGLFLFIGAIISVVFVSRLDRVSAVSATNK